ncbi:MAG TPA: S8 family peptidase [Syntrophales bacterium]|nr:S8 family peptidase [Syntrophales bacterium]
MPGFHPFLRGVRDVLLALAILQIAALGGVAAGERQTDGIGRAPLAQAAEKAVLRGPGEALDVRVEGEHISVAARGADIRDILAAVRDRTGVPIAMDGDIRGRIDLSLSRVSLEELLRTLCRNRAIEYTYDPERKAYRIVRAVLPASGPAGAAAPVAAAGNSPPPPPASMDGHAARGAGDPASGKTLLTAAPVLPESSTGEAPRDSRGRLLYKPREILVKFRPEAGAGEIRALHAKLGGTVLKTLPSRSLQRVRVREGMSEAEALAAYRASGLTVIAERHALRYPDATPEPTVPNDPDFPKQWGLHNTEQRVTVKDTYPDINALAAWNLPPGSGEVVIAVIDTGLDYTHPDLAGRIWTNPAEIPGNGLDDDGNSFDGRILIDDVRGWDFADDDNDPRDRPVLPTDSFYGHGTHVAGIIGARGDNGAGIAGVFWNAKIMALKAQSDYENAMEDFDIIAALHYAAAMGARIVNCSFGGDTASLSEYEAFEALRQAGILVVAAAGNNGVDLDDPQSPKTYPACYARHDYDATHPALDHIIAVAAGDQNDGLSAISNYGAASVDLMAPGVVIYSTLPGNSYGYKTGTSMAAPHVAGIAGLLLARDPTLTYAQVKAAILSTVDPIASVATKLVTGGRANAHAARATIASVPGDITGDGFLNLADAVAGLHLMAGFPSERFRNPDLGALIGGNSEIGMAEVLFILQSVAGVR